ncbi:four helix bundle protein [Flavobacterium psychrophilum]|nr:four helix bundle protein [Flavobacterium psychrophilum]MCB6087143.1 four helix bundle protein [Flavobacterium psychrophilum]MCB6098185.1 four helix bundle protein [Flavobacterium psychrophilum]
MAIGAFDNFEGYKITSTFGKQKSHALRSQIRRDSPSIATNICEG